MASRSTTEHPKESLARLWRETLQERQHNLDDKSQVASSLQKYRSNTIWPKSGRPLRKGLKDAVEKQEFTRLQTTLWQQRVPVYILMLLGLAGVITGFALVFVKDPDHVPSTPTEDQKSLYVKQAVPLLIVSVIVTIGSFLFISYTPNLLWRHVVALHLLYVEDTLFPAQPGYHHTMDSSDKKVYSAKLGRCLYKVLASGNVTELYVPPRQNHSGGHAGVACAVGGGVGGGGGGGGGGC